MGIKIAMCVSWATRSFASISETARATSTIVESMASRGLTELGDVKATNGTLVEGLIRVVSSILVDTSKRTSILSFIAVIHLVHVFSSNSSDVVLVLVTDISGLIRIVLLILVDVCGFITITILVLSNTVLAGLFLDIVWVLIRLLSWLVNTSFTSNAGIDVSEINTRGLGCTTTES